MVGGAGRLCICIGFTSEQSSKYRQQSAVACDFDTVPERWLVVAVHRVCVSSLVLVGAFLGLTIAGVQPQLLAPFASAVSCFGTVMLYLSLLIISSQHYDHTDAGNKKWLYSNALFVFLLLVLTAAGRTFGLVGMANASTTFACLFILEKYAEFHTDQGWNGWVLMLLVSLAAWCGSLWLHENPGHIISMFSM